MLPSYLCNTNFTAKQTFISILSLNEVFFPYLIIDSIQFVQFVFAQKMMFSRGLNEFLSRNFNKKMLLEKSFFFLKKKTKLV